VFLFHLKTGAKTAMSRENVLIVGARNLLRIVARSAHETVEVNHPGGPRKPNTCSQLTIKLKIPRVEF